MNTADETIRYLDGLGKPPIVTNETNLLLFYKGKSEALPPIDPRYETSTYCGPGLRDFMKGKLLVFYGQAQQTENDYYCPLLFQLALETVKTFGDENGRHYTVYRVN